MEKIKKELLAHQEKVINDGNIVFGTFLRGSQNYGIDTENSDVDSVTLIIPKFEDVVKNNKNVSTTHIFENNSHTDIKDIRLAYREFFKQNISFLEILFTDHFIINPFFKEENLKLRELANEIADYNNQKLFSCIMGNASSERKELDYICSPFNFDNNYKSFSHILRLEEFAKRFYAGEDFSSCLKSKKAEYLKDIKKGEIEFYKIADIANESIENIKRIKDKVEMIPSKENIEVKNKAEELLSKIIKKSFIEEFKKDK